MGLLFLVSLALSLECQSKKCQRINQLFMRIHYDSSETGLQTGSELGEGGLKGSAETTKTMHLALQSQELS